MEENKKNRPWYKKKRYIIPLAIFGLMILGAINSPSTPTNTNQPASVSSFTDSNSVASPTVEAVSTQTVSPVTPTPAVVPTQTQTQTNNDGTTLSNDNHYTNVDGNTVHSPASTSNGSIPAGASARCRDGTYSFSQHRSGTCSHHGGVSVWY